VKARLGYIGYWTVANSALRDHKTVGLTFWEEVLNAGGAGGRPVELGHVAMVQ
jgi:hypothetical protein